MSDNKAQKEEKIEHGRYLHEFSIHLLGRIAFTPDKIKKIVTYKKQNPTNYVKVYNSCDGEHSVSDLAKIASVKQPTMTPILQNWEEGGIIFEVERSGGKFYKKLFTIQ